MESWIDPEKDILRELSGPELIEKLKSETGEYFNVLSQADPTRDIPLPYGKKSTVQGLALGALTHEAFHLGFANKFGDQFGDPQTGKPIERPTSVTSIYG